MGVVADPLDISLPEIGESYKDFDVTDRPLAANMRISNEETPVETALGLAKKGSVLSYQQPILTTNSVEIHQDHPPYPSLPLSEHRMDPTKCVHVCTEEEHFHLLLITGHQWCDLVICAQEDMLVQ
ncbi:hypothetical protein ATANTOWER_030516 [Ataeniobius toweri]|uniref:Uncharacterized protein n=1 Tax=Ataeniobius toweri TaxID=208326 RepID=A0ABU7B082_9TELE|nr:hypothetical protein [Ataeniobius toweri]